MKLLSARICNYKCFRDTGNIEFGPGFNIFIGQNDAGKSALIEALSLSKSALPHRSIDNAPSADSIDDPTSSCSVTYSIDPDELTNHFARQQSILLPGIRNGAPVNPDALQDMFYHAVGNGDQFTAVWQNGNPTSGYLHGLSIFRPAGSYMQFTNTGYPKEVQLSLTNNSATHGYEPNLARSLAATSYAFRAERLNLSSTTSRGSEVLQPGATNLGEVLNWLSTSDRYLFDELVGHIRTIFPHITEVKARLLPTGEIKVTVSTVEPRLSRIDLDVPLDSSGTGIGQVLAILYIVVKLQTPHLILIDEPQSFLHPGAVRKLMEILRQYPKHQYILTTHSPVALTMSDEDRLFLVSRNLGGSVITRITDRGELKTALADVGVRLSDVFGAESVLWVEGRTEEACFPDLIRRLGGKSLSGTVVLGVVNTGDLAGKQASRAFEVYQKLSSETTLLPRPIAFVFDRDLRTEQDMADLTRRSGGLMNWLPLRMYENYLIDPTAIAQLINSLDRERGTPLAAEGVTDWLQRNGGKPEYLPNSSTATFGEPEWEKEVHGARVLDDLFAELTDTRCSYDKVSHGALLTQNLIERPTEKLLGLANLLADLLPT